MLTACCGPFALCAESGREVFAIAALFLSGAGEFQPEQKIGEIVGCWP